MGDYFRNLQMEGEGDNWRLQKQCFLNDEALQSLSNVPAAAVLLPIPGVIYTHWVQPQLWLPISLRAVFLNASLTYELLEGLFKTVVVPGPTLD